ncbi:MAG: type 4a pilus biogenesis protein PilO [Desulfatitalea sp.]|nr:type 4a pilus biogenesis protein PilO [Desulfatitalea sp.]NNK00234.1 type 4a pilus biogenesis protein PilO [Desulfatitalea sp.]
MNQKAAKTGALAPLLEKIEGFSRTQRIAIYVGTLIFVVAFAFYLLFMPKYKEQKALNGQLVRVQQELDKAKKNAAELNDWRNKMKKKEAQYKTVMRALPEKEEIPSLLASISQAGRDAGLDFLHFEPKGEVSKDFYAEIPVDISVAGAYHQVALFFDKVAHLPRIVNIRNISISPNKSSGGGEAGLTTNCQAVTYKFIESTAKAATTNRARGNPRSTRK